MLVYYSQVWVFQPDLLARIVLFKLKTALTRERRRDDSAEKVRLSIRYLGRALALSLAQTQTLTIYRPLTLILISRVNGVACLLDVKRNAPLLLFAKEENDENSPSKHGRGDKRKREDAGLCVQPYPPPPPMRYLPLLVLACFADSP